MKFMLTWRVHPDKRHETFQGFSKLQAEDRTRDSGAACCSRSQGSGQQSCHICMSQLGLSPMVNIKPRTPSAIRTDKTSWTRSCGETAPAMPRLKERA